VRWRHQPKRAVGALLCCFFAPKTSENEQFRLAFQFQELGTSKDLGERNFPWEGVVPKSIWIGFGNLLGNVGQFASLDDGAQQGAYNRKPQFAIWSNFSDKVTFLSRFRDLRRNPAALGKPNSKTDKYVPNLTLNYNLFDSARSKCVSNQFQAHMVQASTQRL
jgi:hypothetical protein